MKRQIQALARVIPNDLDAISAARERFVRDVDSVGYDAESVSALVTGFAEAMANAYAHGNRRDPQRQIFVRYVLKPHVACMDFCDEGDGFDPAHIPDPTSEENIGKPSGRGIWLMRAMFDAVDILLGGRRIQLIKRIRTAS